MTLLTACAILAILLFFWKADSTCKSIGVGTHSKQNSTMHKMDISYKSIVVLFIMQARSEHFKLHDCNAVMHMSPYYWTLSPPKKRNVHSCTNLSSPSCYNTVKAYLSCNAEGWQWLGISLDCMWFQGEHSQAHTLLCQQHFYLSGTNGMQYSAHSPQIVAGE
jgi:hypothetical protein